MGTMSAVTITLIQFSFMYIAFPSVFGLLPNPELKIQYTSYFL